MEFTIKLSTLFAHIIPTIILLSCGCAYKARGLAKAGWQDIIVRQTKPSKSIFFNHAPPPFLNLILSLSLLLAIPLPIKTLSLDHFCCRQEHPGCLKCWSVFEQFVVIRRWNGLQTDEFSPSKPSAKRTAFVRQAQNAEFLRT